MGSAASNVRVEFSDEELATHMAVYGGTGKGKSKLLELMLRQIIDQRGGVCVVDPHGDLVEDLMAHVMHNYDATDERVWRRIHYLEPGSDTARFRFDPFRFKGNSKVSFEDWLHAKARSVAQAIIRMQGEADFAGRPRLERFLMNVLYACGVPTSANGDHLGLGDVSVLLDPRHTAHDAVLSKITPHLARHAPEVLSDFNKVKSGTPRQQEDWIESTIGRLRAFLTPAVKSLFSGAAADSFVFRKVIDQQEVLLVNLRRTPGFTVPQGNAIGGLVINEILEAAQTASRTARRPFYLFIDEASRFVGQDLMDALAQFRKMKLSLCLAVQDLSSLKLRDIDMTAKVISQCGIHVSFQQKNPEDLDVLGQLFGYPLIDFTPLLNEVERSDGYEWVDTESETYGTSTSETSSESMSDGRSSSVTSSRSESEGIGRDKHGMPRSTSESESTGSAESKGDQESRTLGFSAGRGESHSITRSKTPLAKHRTVLQETGRLKRDVSDQFHEIKQMLRILKKGQAVVSVDGTTPFRLDVEAVNPPFPSISEVRRLNLVDGFKKFLGQNHPYCFDPAEQDDQDGRLARFLGEQKKETGDSVFNM